MSATYDYDDGMTICISDAGHKRLSDEQRIQSLDPLYVKIKLGSAAGSVVTIAALVITHLLGS